MTETDRGQVGLIGLGTMGRALTEALVRAGFDVHAADPLDVAPAPVNGATIHRDAASVVAALAPPRGILMMVTAGEAVDAVIGSLRSGCAPGDVLIDGGNSHFRDTERREGALAEDGVRYVGAGISGGEEGARNGASVMAGGTVEACEAAAGVLTAIAAEHDGARCFARVGPGGAGHFVKMVHNGIEYALMQAIAEAHFLLHRGAALGHGEIAGRFRGWCAGPLDSYLLRCAADVLATPDGGGGALLDALDDRAGESGTGRWVTTEAMALGVPAPSITEAVNARLVSGQSSLRTALRSGREAAPLQPTDALVGDVGAALLGASLAAFGQGFAIIFAAGARDGWTPDGATIAAIWRKGCIVQGALVDEIGAAFARDAGLPHLLLDNALAALIADHGEGLRRTVSAGVSTALPIPVMASSLAWVDALRAGRLWTALVQAQRDYFGRHGLRRLDRDEVFHADWRRDGGA